LWHLKVGYDEVRLELFGECETTQSVFGHANHLDWSKHRQQASQGKPGQRRIVYDHGANFAGRVLPGSRG